jgi:hypothetical protein
MAFDEVQTGCVIEYQYLWRREALAGQIEGLKRRPTAVAFRMECKQSDIVYLMPITTKEPDANTLAIEVPQIEKKRSGLDLDFRQWIILSEMNADLIPGSFVLEPNAKIGMFSKAFFQSVLRLWKENQSRTAITKRL